MLTPGIEVKNGWFYYLFLLHGLRLESLFWFIFRYNILKPIWLGLRPQTGILVPLPTPHKFSHHFRQFRATLVCSHFLTIICFASTPKKVTFRHSEMITQWLCSTNRSLHTLPNISGNFEQLFFFFFFWPNLSLTQQVKSVQSPVSSRQLKHLRHSSRKSSGISS